MSSQWQRFGEQTKPTPKLEKIAKSIKGDGLEYIDGVLSWMKDYFHPCKEEAKEKLLYTEYLTKTAGEITKGKVEIACSDKALIFVTLMRLKGIPAKYVETVHNSCIEDEKEEEVKQHAFSEVFVGGKWVLVNPEGGRVEGDVDYEKLGYVKFREGLDAWNLGWHKLKDMESEAKSFIEKAREKKGV